MARQLTASEIERLENAAPKGTESVTIATCWMVTVYPNCPPLSYIVC